MTFSLPIAFDSPRPGLIAVCLLIPILYLLIRGRPLRRRTPGGRTPGGRTFGGRTPGGQTLGGLPANLIAAGSILLALAAAGPVWVRPVVGTVAVLVDLSPSTRGATFRDRAALDDRIARLLGKTPFQTFAFSDRIRPLPPAPTEPDLPCQQTILTAPPSDALLLFSDGRFPRPAGLPPTYPVIDPALDDPPDSAVTRLDCTSELATATVRQDGPRRAGSWTGANPTADPLSAVPAAADIRYALSPGDLWPENDSLSIRRPEKFHAARWWVGESAPIGWTGRAPTQLPTDPAGYLGPAVVVLNDIAATDLSTAQQDALSAYVRDFGGGLVIVGGPRAFAAGAYDRTRLDELSPLASAPPDPAARWVILVDGSGSMSSPVPGGSTAWQTEAAAARAIVAALPASDKVTVGSFAAAVKPWITDVPAGQIDPGKLPPLGLGPYGPTNLQAALESFTGSASLLSTRVLLMTDADAQLTGPDLLAAKLRDRHVWLSVLATGDGPALPALRAIAAATGGSVVEQPEPTRWISAAQALARAARPDGLRVNPIMVWLDPPLTGSVLVSPWNPTWARDKTLTIARSPDRPMAATWNAGLGKVTAIAWQADPAMAARLANPVAAPPVDPRFKVTVDPGRAVRICVDAADGPACINGLHITAAVGDAPPVAIRQTAPGEYTASIPAPREPAVVTVFADGRVIDRVPVAGRYPPEFDGIGNDRAALQALADRTGGRVTPPGPASPIDFRWPVRAVPLLSPLLIAGLVATSLGLIAWRRNS